MPEAADASRRHRDLQAMQVDVWLSRERGPRASAEIAVGSPEAIVPLQVMLIPAMVT